MSKRIAHKAGSIAALALACVLLISSVAGAAPAENADRRLNSRTCSSAILYGSFGFFRNGTSSVGPLAAVGIITLDGKGNATVSQSIAKNGVIAFDVDGTFTVEVAADCTGKGFTPDGTEFVRLVVFNQGRGFYMLSESPGNSVYGVATKIN